MRVKYNTPPPAIVTNVPPFIFKRYAKGIINSLIRWAEREYYNAIIELYATSELAIAKYYEENYTFLDFMAHSKTFRDLVPMIQNDVWDVLDRKTQDILIGARNIMLSTGSR